MKKIHMHSHECVTILIIKKQTKNYKDTLYLTIIATSKFLCIAFKKIAPIITQQTEKLVFP